MRWHLLYPVLVLSLTGCVSAVNLDAIRAVKVPEEVSGQDRQECETVGTTAGEKSFPSKGVRTAADIGLWPIPELIIASERDNAATSAYRQCLRDRGYAVLEPK